MVNLQNPVYISYKLYASYKPTSSNIIRLEIMLSLLSICSTLQLVTMSLSLKANTLANQLYINLLIGESPFSYEKV